MSNEQLETRIYKELLESERANKNGLIWAFGLNAGFILLLLATLTVLKAFAII